MWGATRGQAQEERRRSHFRTRKYVRTDRFSGRWPVHYQGTGGIVGRSPAGQAVGEIQSALARVFLTCGVRLRYVRLSEGSL